MIQTNLSLVRKTVTRQQVNLDLGARAARDEMAMTLQQLAKEEIKGRRPAGEKATAGQPPMNRTGNLRRSIHTQKFRLGLAKYTAVVGPGIVYGRAVEMGGSYAPRSWRNSDAVRGFPYMSPAFAKFKSVSSGILAKHLAARS